MNFLTAHDGFLLRAGLYLLVFWPTVGYYVYSDAQYKELSYPRLRGVVLGVLGIVGVLVHLLFVDRLE